MMIKGVNKQVLEVTNTENPYFEKIIFFVKPEYVNADREKLKKEAHLLAKSANKPPRARKTKREIRYICIQARLCGRGDRNNVSFKLFHLISGLFETFCRLA